MSVGITLKNLVKFFTNVRAVDDISLDINPGELFFLLGPSGCGKTTLLRCIAGFNQPDAGKIFIGAREVTNLPAHARDTGMVFQSYALWPHMSVSENVEFGLEMRNIAKPEIRRRVQEALAMVQMIDRSDYKPNQLSGGQQQRVALARALVIRPTCLLLDEPLSNLDAKLRLEMRSEIRRICKASGLTAVYVTHDQNEALSMADRMAILNDGHIQQLGTAQDIYRHPNSRYVAEFIGESNFIEGRIAGIDASRIVVKTALGLVTCITQDSGFYLDQTVILSIRPEVIRFQDLTFDMPNTFTGTVYDSLYLGEMAQHRIKCKHSSADLPDLELKAFELNPRINARDAAQEVRFGFVPEDVVMLVG